MIRLIVCISFLVSVFPTLFGQGGAYLPGWYVTNEGDTVGGFIREDVPLETSRGIRFKAEKGGKALRVAPAQFQEAKVGESDFYLTHRQGPEADSQLIVLRQVVRGPVDLFRGFAPGKGGYIYYLREGASMRRIDRKNFGDWLSRLRRACPQADLSGTYRFGRRDDVVSLVRTYNACRFPADTVALLEARPRPEVYLGLKPAWQAGRLELQEGNYYGDGEYDGYSGFGGGAVAQLRLNPYLAFTAELSYLRQEAHSDYVNVPPTEVEETFSRVTYRFHYLEVPFTFQYGLPLGSVRPFAEAGFSFGIPLSRSLEDELTVADPDHAAYKPRNDFRSWNFGATAGAGVQAAVNARLSAQFIFRVGRGRIRQEVYTSLAPSGPLFSYITDFRYEAALRLLWKLR